MAALEHNTLAHQQGPHTIGMFGYFGTIVCLLIHVKIKWIGLLGHLCAQENQECILRMVRWVRWHCSSDTGYEIQTLDAWDRARYPSVTEALHNTEFYEWMGKNYFWFFSNRRDRESNKAWKAAALTTTLWPPIVIQNERYFALMLGLCWATIYDARLPFKQHLKNVLCFTSTGVPAVFHIELCRRWKNPF